MVVIEMSEVLLLIFVKFEVRDFLFETAGAGQAGVTKDTTSTLRDVSFECYFLQSET